MTVSCWRGVGSLTAAGMYPHAERWPPVLAVAGADARHAVVAAPTRLHRALWQLLVSWRRRATIEDPGRCGPASARGCD